MHFIINKIKKLNIKNYKLNKVEDELYGSFKKYTFCIFQLENNLFKLNINGKNYNSLTKEKILDFFKKIKKNTLVL